MKKQTKNKQVFFHRLVPELDRYKFMQILSFNILPPPKPTSPEV